MTNYDHIALIFNPNSTGDAPATAEKLRQDLKSLGREATMTPTMHAGHAEELAYAITKKYRRPLIISVSGDGGYHEVINGAMRAKIERGELKPVVAVAAAGNANDHRRVVRAKPLAAVIAEHQPTPIDLLKLTVKTRDKRLERYAHSYIGFGVTPAIAVELNRHSLSRRKELEIILRSFWKYKKFIVEHDNKQRSLDSLIFANINEMAKVIKLHDTLNLRDGQFEVIEFAHSGRLKLLAKLIRAVFWGLKNQPSYTQYEFSTLTPQPVQSDGEVEHINGRARVLVESVPAAIDSLF